MLPSHRPPTHSGEMLLKEFLEPLEVSQVEAASRMNIRSSDSTPSSKDAGRSAPIPPYSRRPRHLNRPLVAASSSFSSTAKTL